MAPTWRQEERRGWEIETENWTQMSKRSPSTNETVSHAYRTDHVTTLLVPGHPHTPISKVKSFFIVEF